MRKSLGVLLATACLLPLGVIGASPASAAAGTTCKTTAGTVTWTPALPKANSPKKKVSISATGTFGGCSGAVKSATTTLKTPVGTTASNCSSTLTYSTGAEATGTLTVKWNTGSPSVVSVSLYKVKGSPTQALVKGVVKSGQFAGLHSTGTVTYTPKVGNCTTTDLKSATYKQVGNLVFK